MFPVILNAGYFTIYSWGLMVAIGYLAALLTSAYLTKKDGVELEHTLTIYIYTAIFSIIGARSFFVLQFIGEYIKHPMEILMIQRGGFVFLGGFMAAFLAIYIYVRMNKLDIWRVLDVMSPGVMLGYAIGRIGCFLNGCCYGIVTKVPWAVRFPPEECFRHPTQLYSFFASLTIFGILLAVFNSKRFTGQVFLLAVSMYSVYRFILEFFRYSPIRPAGLTLSQYITVIFLVASIAFLWNKKNTTS